MFGFEGQVKDIGLVFPVAESHDPISFHSVDVVFLVDNEDFSDNVDSLESDIISGDNARDVSLAIENVLSFVVR